MKGGDAKPEGAKISVMLKKYSRDAGRFWKVSFFCMPKWVRKLAGTGSLYIDKSRITKHETE